MQVEPLMTPQQAADYLAVSLSSLYTNWRVWGIPAHKIGKHLRFRVAEVDAWIASQVA